MQPTIRPIAPSDIDAILAIENRSFSAPFTREMFVAMVGQVPFSGFVAELDARLQSGDISSGWLKSPPSGDRRGSPLLGYIIFSLVKDEMELLTIAVDEPFRLQKIASQLMQKMMDVAKEKKVKKIFLEVRPSNTAAQTLYKNFSFKPVGIRKGYYKDTGEDAVVMEARLRF